MALLSGGCLCGRRLPMAGMATVRAAMPCRRSASLCRRSRLRQLIFRSGQGAWLLVGVGGLQQAGVEPLVRLEAEIA